MFEDFDFDGLFDDDEAPHPPPSDDVVAAVEQELGYKLPAAYVELARRHNGGDLRRNAHKTKEQTSWSEDRIAVVTLFSIVLDGDDALCGDLGSKFWMEEWGYPDIGVYFADCPSAGHDMVCLDYRACGPDGEPQVVHVDQGDDYRTVVVAPTFEDFIRGLYEEDDGW